MKRYWGRWQRWLNNHNLKTKLMIMFFFCVLLPVMVTNTLIITGAMDADRIERERIYQGINASVKYSINEAVGRTVFSINDIYTNREIMEFLEARYLTPLAFFSAYSTLNEKSMMHAQTGQNIKASTAYADNDTIIEREEFASLGTVEDEAWYQDFQSAGKDMLIYTYFDSKKKLSEFGDESRRTISIIRKLDFFGSCGCTKIVKHDLDYGAIARDITSANYDAKVYVCIGDRILFDNVGHNNRMMDYADLTNEIITKADIKSTINLYGTSWNIYIVGKPSGILDYLQTSAGALAVLILINLLLPIVVMLGVNRSISKRILLLGEHLDMVKDENFVEIDPVEGKDEIGALIGNYNLMVAKMKDLIEVVYKDKIERQELNLSKQQAELQALHSQINPHFMFNALESIRMRSIIKKEEETADIIGELAILMRRSINWGMDDILLQDEMQFAEAYLQLQKYRFGERLSYEISVAEEVRSVRIPKLTIVTFVENACVHGIEEVSRPGKVSVTVKKEAGDLLIEVQDTGAGMEAELAEGLLDKMHHAGIEMLEEGKPVGIVNACIRLYHMSNGKVEFDLESQKNIGTKVSIRITLKGKKERV